ncbi:hypothetical protein DBV15_08744 [Temnothorax longispinosus]|uniref:Uncharacterized protein n=1 Tax=Temnothorax longispinosus TaxID=300112 RepID=A0A4V3SB74_9HYME|nr:hypothetical protein DBV15_08744 [Temnothorax longispinosus]
MYTIGVAILKPLFFNGMIEGSTNFPGFKQEFRSGEPTSKTKTSQKLSNLTKVAFNAEASTSADPAEKLLDKMFMIAATDCLLKFEDGKGENSSRLEYTSQRETTAGIAAINWQESVLLFTGDDDVQCGTMRKHNIQWLCANCLPPQKSPPDP